MHFLSLQLAMEIKYANWNCIFFLIFSGWRILNWWFSNTKTLIWKRHGNTHVLRCIFEKILDTCTNTLNLQFCFADDKHVVCLEIFCYSKLSAHTETRGTRDWWKIIEQKVKCQSHTTQLFVQPPMSVYRYITNISTAQFS